MLNEYFSLDSLLTYENYFGFMELYFKKHKVLRKSMIDKTGINAGTYRSFLKDISKNKLVFYKKISNAYKVYLPDESRIKQLNKLYNKIFIDFLLLKKEYLNEDLDLINKEIGMEVNSLESLPFLLLKTLIQLSAQNLSYRQKVDTINELFLKIEPYESIITSEFRLIYSFINIYRAALLNYNYTIFIPSVIKDAKKYQFLNGIILSDIATMLESSGDYTNAIVYCSDAIESFHKEGNIIRLIVARHHLAIYYLLINNYFKSFEIFHSLYLHYDILPSYLLPDLLVCYFDTLVLMEKYEDSYAFYVEKRLQIQSISALSKITFLFLCSKLKKDEEAHLIYNEILNDITIFTPYVIVAKAIYEGFYGKLRSKLKLQTVDLINNLKNAMARLLCISFINGIKNKNQI